jgi:PAS domain S-box-containing protein
LEDDDGRLAERPVGPAPEAPSELAILDVAVDAVLVLDTAGRITYWSTGAEQTYGWSREEAVGRRADELLQSEHPLPRDEIARLVAEHGVWSGDVLEWTRDGRHLVVESRWVADRDDAGRLRGVLQVNRDVTEQRAADRALHRLARMIESAGDAIATGDLDGLVTSWNGAAERMFGYTAREIIGRDIRMIVPSGTDAAFAALTRGEEVRGFRTRQRRKDGTFVTVAGSAAPVRDATDAVVGWSVIARDLSEVERGEARFHGLLDSAPDPIVCVDGHGTILFASLHVERVLGYHRDELIGRSVELLVPEEARAGHPGQRLEYLADPQMRPMGHGRELAVRCRDGTTIQAEISLSTVHTDEGVLVLAAVRDVRERNRIQAEREQLRAEADRQRLRLRVQEAQRLESLGQLAGGVAHDFNNLLGAMRNYASFVREEVARAEAEDPERWASVRADAEAIETIADRAAELTHQLLAFARRDVVRPELLDLNAVVRQVEQMLRRTLGEHITLTLLLDPMIERVRADRSQIERVILNLAVNARDAMPTGGTLTIDTSIVDVDDSFVESRPGTEPGRYVRLRVSDTGVGMPRDVVEHVFEPFFTTKAAGEGTGLGLATVYGIVTQAGGFAYVYSEPGVGTAVATAFPAAGVAAAVTPVLTATPAPRGREAIVVVEDDDAMRDVTARILTRHGYEVTAVATGHEALALAADPTRDIHLLVTDVVMPQMLGTQVAEEVTALRPDVKVLFMSGYARGILGVANDLAPDVLLVEKPFTGAAILKAVREALDAR